jgi:pyridoxine 4-dehydrogenase
VLGWCFFCFGFVCCVCVGVVGFNWCCYQGVIPLVGMRNKSQVIDVSNVFKWNLNKEEFKLLQEVSKSCLKKMPKNPFSST